MRPNDAAETPPEAPLEVRYLGQASGIFFEGLALQRKFRRRGVLVATNAGARARGQHVAGH